MWVPAWLPAWLPAWVLASALALAVLQEQGPPLQPKPLLRQPPKPSTGLQLGFLLAFPDSELVPVFPDLELVPVFLDSELVQYLEHWLQLKRPNTEWEGPGLLAEQVSQAVWQEPDLRPQPLLPKPPPKPPSMVVELEAWALAVGPAWGNPVAGRESELPRTPDSRPHQRWCYCLVENVNPL